MLRFETWGYNWALRLGFKPQGWNLSLKAEIWASRLRFEPWGWDFSLRADISGLRQKLDPQDFDFMSYVFLLPYIIKISSVFWLKYKLRIKQEKKDLGKKNLSSSFSRVCLEWTVPNDSLVDVSATSISMYRKFLTTLEKLIQLRMVGQKQWS